MHLRARRSRGVSGACRWARRVLHRVPGALGRTQAAVQGVCRLQGSDARAHAKPGALSLAQPCQPQCKKKDVQYSM